MLEQAMCMSLVSHYSQVGLNDEAQDLPLAARSTLCFFVGETSYAWADGKDLNGQHAC